MSANSSQRANECAAGGEESARVFSAGELAEHNGKVPGRPILIAYEGHVYDVGDLFMWMTGQHFWLLAGCDLSGLMSESPHGEEMLGRARRVGRLAGD